jgi:hypothetical protein
VQHGHAEAVQVEFGDRGGAPVGNVRLVVVSDHGDDRRVLGQFGQHRGGADIARVQDQVRGSQVGGDRLRADPPPARPVSIGKHHHAHDPHHALASLVACPFSTPAGSRGYHPPALSSRYIFTSWRL